MRTQVRLPSDNLTHKQRKELNGVATTYSMDKPHTYYELLAFPKDIRKQYIEGIINKYHPSVDDMKRMLKCNGESYKSLLKTLETSHPRYYRNADEKIEWDVFCGRIPKTAAVKTEEAKEVKAPSYWDKYSTIGSGIGKVDHISLHVTGKPMSVANGLPLILDPNKEYYFSINIVEHQNVPVPMPEEVLADESDLCEAEAIC